MPLEVLHLSGFRFTSGPPGAATRPLTSNTQSRGSPTRREGVRRVGKALNTIGKGLGLRDRSDLARPGESISREAEHGRFEGCRVSRVAEEIRAGPES